MTARRGRSRRLTRATGQATIEYVLIICACSIPLSYAISRLLLPKTWEFMFSLMNFVVW